MSGVLERMAKRALSGLLTVQPLIRSMYAAGPVNAEEPAAPGFLPSKVEVEREVAAPERLPDRVSETESAAPRRPRVAAAPKVDQVAAPLETRAEPAMPQAVRQPPQGPRVQPPLPHRTPIAPPPAAADARANPEPLQQIALMAPVIPMRQDDVAPMVEELTPAGVASPPVSTSQATSPPLQRRRLRAVRAESAAPAEQKAEIHISIGSIELRAAPAEPRPAAPAPFRPRVSLQDFLSRKTDARR